MPDGSGYWFTATDGGLFNYGKAPFYGAGNSEGLSDVVGMATDGAPTPQAASRHPGPPPCVGADRRMADGAAGTSTPRRPRIRSAPTGAASAQDDLVVLHVDVHR